MEANPLKVGSRIKSIRKNIGLNQTDFAKKINATLPAVSNWETGKNIPNNERLKAISNLVNISVDELLHGSAEEIIYSGINNTLIDFKKLNIEVPRKDIKEIFNSIKREIDDFPYTYTSPESIYELSQKITVDYLSGNTKNDSGILNKIIQELNHISEDLLESSYYTVQDTGENKLFYNYNLLTYQVSETAERVLRDGMDENIYNSIKKVLSEATESLSNIFESNFGSREEKWQVSAKAKKIILTQTIQRTFDNLPISLKNDKNFEIVEKYILENAEHILGSYNHDDKLLDKIEKDNLFTLDVDIEKIVKIIKGEEKLELTYLDLEEYKRKKLNEL